MSRTIEGPATGHTAWGGHATGESSGRYGARHRAPLRGAQRLAVTWVLGLAVGIAVSWRVLGQPGVVGLVHDWSIPPFGDQNIALLRQMTAGWYSWGLGLPIAYPLEYPLRIAFALAALCGLNGALLSKSIVVFVPAFAFVAATTLGRACRLPLVAAWLCGAFYALDPVMLNKLVSGQITYLAGYALLPLVPATFIAAGEGRRPLLTAVALGALLALVGMQVQLGFLAFALLLLLAALTTSVPLRRRLGIVVTAAAVLAAIELPTLFWLSHGVTGLEQLDQFGHRSAWLVANSLAPADAVRLIGYLAKYDVSSTAGWTVQWQFASWLVLAVIASGFVVLRDPMRTVCLVLALLTLLFVTGTNTVLGPAIRWSFEHVPLAQMFRELYHAMAIVSLAYALAAGACFALVSRLRKPILAQIAVVAVVAAYVAPMLSGDISGWLQVAPVDTYLANVYRDHERGPGRFVWFPLDEPLAYDGRGAGVDPMAITARGSLWLYTLAWPLTAVDMTARSGNMPLLKSELQALGVATAVNRDRMLSRFEGYSADGAVARRLFDRPLEFGPQLGTVHAYASDLHAYELPHPLGIGFMAERSAIVPRRLSVVAGLQRTATFAFDQQLPHSVPHDFYYDPGDLHWEALQVAGVARPFVATGVDARHAFAGGDVWWWYRPEYADSLPFAIALGRAHTTVDVPRAVDDARLVVAWIASVAGGELRVDCGTAHPVIDTGGAWGAWRSIAIECGPLSSGAQVRLDALDDNAEVALRGAQVVDGATLARADRRLAEARSEAAAVVALRSGGGSPTGVVRTGTSPSLGTLTRGVPAVLEVTRASGSGAHDAVWVEAPDGYVVAWRRFAGGGRRLRVPLMGDGTPLTLRTGGTHLRAWQLVELRLDGEVPPVRTGGGRAGLARVQVYNQTFDRGWQVDGAIEHIPSALGTNAFVLSSTTGEQPVRFAFSSEYRAAFAAGILALLVALAAGALLLILSYAEEGRSSGAAERVGP